MDSEDEGEADDEIGSENSNTTSSDVDDSHGTHLSGDGQSSRSTNLMTLKQILQLSSGKVRCDAKWSEQKANYHDAYRDLFRSHDAKDETEEDAGFGETQLGTVTWQPDEKGRLFKALSRKGRLDPLALAEAVNTKSQLEVTDYIRSLKKQLDDRHLFARHAEHTPFSHANIPAAYEIGNERDLALEKAADALAALQEHYEHVIQCQKPHESLRIDWEVAEALDNIAEDSLERGSNEVTDRSAILTISELFHLGTFIDLSTKLYMSSADAEKDWRGVAFEDETPAIAFQVINDLHHLVVNLTRKAMQSATFLAMSRQRSMTRWRGHHSPASNIVKKSDMVAAIDVLDMKRDSWQYWVTAARRHTLLVLIDSHRQGESTKLSLPYDVVEDALRTRFKREHHRRSRSVSVATEEFPRSSLESEASTTHSENYASGSEPANTSETKSAGFMEDMSSTDTEFDSSVDSDPASISSGSWDMEGSNLHFTTPADKIRRNHQEQQQDQHLEELDCLASQQEENSLWQLLEPDTESTNIKDEVDETPNTKPAKAFRKAPDDMRDWTDSIRYKALWETFGIFVGEECFIETEHVRKRRKLETQES